MSELDNRSAFSSAEYDESILRVIPHYGEIQENIIDLALAHNPGAATWMDVGCGTGTLVRRAVESLPVCTFTLCDPSEAMLDRASAKLSDYSRQILRRQQAVEDIDDLEQYDIITVMQMLHYLPEALHAEAIGKLYRALRPGGMLITVDNTAPETEEGLALALDRWGRFQTRRGRGAEEVGLHLARYGVDYMPLTAGRQREIMLHSGFSVVDTFWQSYLQTGIFGIKSS